MIVPIFLPHLGCDSRCIYCNQNDITGEREDDLRRRVEKALQGKAGTYEVGLFGGSIFGIGQAALRLLLRAFDAYSDHIEGFRISTKPVPLDGEIVELLGKAGTRVVELGIPSFSDDCLTLLNRGHSVRDVIDAFRYLRKRGFGVALQVMVGLPGETAEDIEQTVESLLLLRPDYVRIYPLAVLRDTALAGLVGSGAITLPPFEVVLARVVHLYLGLGRGGIRVASMGLTDGEVLRENVAGGAYHPAFGFLVKSEAFFGAVVFLSKREGVKGPVLVRLNGRDVPHLVGYRRRNMERFAAQGLSVSWEMCDDEGVGSFHLIQGSREQAGTIFDAFGTG